MNIVREPNWLVARRTWRGRDSMHKAQVCFKHQHAGVGHYHLGHLLITVSAVLKDTHVTYETLEDKV